MKPRRFWISASWCSGLPMAVGLPGFARCMCCRMVRKWPEALRAGTRCTISSSKSVNPTASCCIHMKYPSDEAR